MKTKGEKTNRAFAPILIHFRPFPAIPGYSQTFEWLQMSFFLLARNTWKDEFERIEIIGRDKIAQNGDFAGVLPIFEKTSWLINVLFSTQVDKLQWKITNNPRLIVESLTI
jgi:hypothetical protein